MASKVVNPLKSLDNGIHVIRVFVTLLSIFLTLQHVAAVVNSGQTKEIEESVKTKSENKESDKNDSSNTADLVAESSESANRREAPAILDTYGVPSLGSSGSGHISLPVPIYGVPNAPSNNVVYPALPPDIPPPAPKASPASLYGLPALETTYGIQVNQLPSTSKLYGAPLPLKYGAPLFSYNQFAPNLIPQKSPYGPSKSTYVPLSKPLKYYKYPTKNFNLRPSKPIYGAPYKYNFNANAFKTNNLNGLYTNSLYANNGFPIKSSSNLYSGLSSLNHQYGAPVSSVGQSVSLQYGTPSVANDITTQYGVPDKTIASGLPIIAYGPPQPSANPKPPHPGAPAPPTPPDIKYDGWQPIIGLVSKRPDDEVQHLTAEGSGYHDLSPPPLEVGHNQIGESYGAPVVSLLDHGNSLLDQPGLSDSYGVALNSVTGSNGVSDSYSAPLGTVTGSGGIVASSGAEAHGAGSHSHSNSQSGSHSLSLDLSTIGVSDGSDIQALKSIQYDLGSHSGSSPQISASYGLPEAGAHSSGNLYASGHSYNNFGSPSHSYKGSLRSHAPIGLVPPNGKYGTPLTSQYGASLNTNNIGGYKSSSRSGLYASVEKGSYKKGIHTLVTHTGSSRSNSYLPPSPLVPPSSSYGVPKGNGAISFQNVALGSSTAGIDLQHSTLNIEGANSLPLTSYNVPLGSIDGSYTLPTSSNSDDVSVSLDYSHPPASIDLTEDKQASLSHDCYKQHQVPSLAYGIPSPDSYTSSLSSPTTNIANPHRQSIVSQPNYEILDLAAPQTMITVPSSKYELPSPQYGVPDLLHSSSLKTEAKVNSVIESEESHGKNYGKSVAASFGPNSELVESQSIDLNNIPIQGNLGSYTLQIQSAEGGSSQIPHTQVLNEGLLQSILQAIEQPGKQGQNTKYPIILQPSVERNNYSINEPLSSLDSSHQPSEIKEVIIEAPKDNNLDDKSDNHDNEKRLQLLDTSNIALYYKKNDEMNKVDIEEKSEETNVENESN